MFGQGQRSTLSYVLEVAKGVTPGSPSMKYLRNIGRNLNTKRKTLESREVQPNGQTGFMRHGMESIDGPIGFELSSGSYVDMFLSLMRSATWAAVTTSGTPNLASTVTTNKFTRATGSWITDGYRIGDVIRTTGFANPVNNGTFTVLAVTATDITVDGALATEVSAGSRTLVYPGKRLDVGSAMPTFTFERRFEDIAQYQLSRGVAVNVMDLTIQPEAITSGAFTMLGLSGALMSGSTLGAPAAAPTTQPMTAFEGAIIEGGAKIAVVTGVTLKADNGRSLTGVVGSKFSPDVFEGTFKVTGQLSAFIQDAVLFNKFYNESVSNLAVRCDDPDGNFVGFAMQTIKYTGDDIDPPQQGGVVQALPFRALGAQGSVGTFTIQDSSAT